MPRFKGLISKAIIAALFCLCVAAAQNISVYSGNGQLTCPGCPQGVLSNFEPLIVKVTDANGNPVSGAVVNWSVNGNAGLQYGTTTTNQNGLSTNNIIAGFATTGTSQAYYQQWIVTATTGSSSVTFAETQNLLDVSYNILANVISPPTLSTFTGSAGAQASPQILVHVANNFGPIPGISVRLVNPNGPVVTDKSPSGAPPAMTCMTGAGADPGSVLTDANGDATCTPVFGSAIGQNQRVDLLVGGVPSSVFPGNEGLPIGYWVPAIYQVTVTAATPGLITKVSGDNQTANPGATLPSALVAKVTDAPGQATIANVPVNWTVIQGAATLGSATGLSDSQGLVSNTVQLSSNAAGTVLVKVALANNATISQTFTVTANVTVSGLTKVSGDNQSAVVSQTFAQNLVVLVNGSNGRALANYPVQFAVSGPGTISASSATTNLSGVAEIGVTAGSTAGTVTVTATAGSSTQTFTLTVIPAGPQITSFTNGAQFYTTSDANHSALSPCGIATVYGTGIAPPNFTGAAASVMFGPMPTSFMGVRVQFGTSSFAPIYNVAKQNGVEQATFQVPCDVTPGSSVPVTITANGGTRSTTVVVRAAGPGIFETTALSQNGTTLRAILLKADGSFVNDTTNPARRGDTIRMYATGLGATLPAVAGTNALAPVGIDALVRGQVIVGVNNAGVRVISARLSPDLIGVYEVDFQIPSDAPASGDVVLSLAINAIDGSATQFSLGSKIYIR